MLYDAFAVFSVLFVADALVVIPLQVFLKITDIGGHPAFQLYQGLLIATFYLWFWTHGGQTLGMRAWHIRLVRNDGGTATWGDALKRLFAALLSWLPAGLGFLWMLVDPERLTWHDRLSATRIVVSRD